MKVEAGSIFIAKAESLHDPAQVEARLPTETRRDDELTPTGSSHMMNTTIRKP